MYKPKPFIKPWKAPNTNNVSSNIERLLIDIIKKYPYDIPHEQLVAEFGFKLKMLNKEKSKVGGSYDFRNKVINIVDYWEEYNESTFCHEFSHLLQDVADESDFYKDYNRGNTLFSQTVRQEQDACNISLLVWEWLYPGKPYSEYLVPYYEAESIKWLGEYYAPYFENDLLV